jgi:F-type H+-transporting ATPase subunit epsilon
MKLRVFTPSEVVLECEAVHVTAEDTTGSLGIRADHAPLVTPLVRGILMVRQPDGVERFVVVDRGVLLVCDDVVLVASRQAVESDSIADLDRISREQFEQEAELDKSTHVAFEKMRISFMRGVLEMERAGDTL